MRLSSFLLPLLGPLLGGFLFARTSYYTKYTVRRMQGRRLLFYAATAGFFLFWGAWFLIYGFNIHLPCVLDRFCADNIADTSSVFRSVNGRDVYLSIVGFFLGFIAYPLNYFSRKLDDHLDHVRTIWDDPIRFTKETNRGSLWLRFKWWLSRWGTESYAVRDQGDELEVFIGDAFWRGRMILVTLDSGKVYAGHVTDPPDPGSEREYLSMLPLHSGYRDSENKKITWVINYAVVLDEITPTREGSNEDQSSEASENTDGDSSSDSSHGTTPEHGDVDDQYAEFEVILPLRQMQSVHFFSYKADTKLRGTIPDGWTPEE